MSKLTDVAASIGWRPRGGFYSGGLTLLVTDSGVIDISGMSEQQLTWEDICAMCERQIKKSLLEIE